MIVSRTTLLKFKGELSTKTKHIDVTDFPEINGLFSEPNGYHNYATVNLRHQNTLQFTKTTYMKHAFRFLFNVSLVDAFPSSKSQSVLYYLSSRIIVYPTKYLSRLQNIVFYFGHKSMFER